MATVLTFDSSPGDYIGQGQSRRFVPPAATFIGQMVGANGRLELFILVDGQNWYLDVAAPPGRRLEPGSYAYTASNQSGPSFYFGGDGRGCSVAVGDFQVLQAEYGPPVGRTIISGTVRRFHAKFTQRCNGPASPPLTGEVVILALTPSRD